MAEASKEIEQYFALLDKPLKKIYKIATEARKKGFDPEEKVEIPIAKNMAERVEGLISAVSPQIIGKGISKRINELEKKYGILDWRVSLIIAEEVAREKFCKFKDKIEAMEMGVRVGLAYITLGTVSAPLEGFTYIRIKKTKSSKEYLSMYFSGPIRAAGGTAESVSVLIADYIRKKFGYAEFDPDETEINRFVREIYDYHERITNLQYLPSPEEIKFFIKHLPIQINGDPSEKIEVSNYKDLPRVETNNLRNGVCLVISEGLTQKAPKLWKQLEKWGKDFDMQHWNFLKEFLELQKRIKALDNQGKPEEETLDNSPASKIKPDYTFIKDLVAGRPVLTHPLRSGGFRLRYGRSRISGYSAYSIHPCTMLALNKYIATGTQLKVERPGKATVLTPNESIEGPIVLLNNGSVLQLNDEQIAKKHINTIKKILYMGDILISYGEFLNRAHVLVPPGYCEEWWVKEFEKGVVDLFGNLDLDKTAEESGINKKFIERILNNPLKSKISSEAALILSKSLNIPFHPRYTFFWSAISKQDLIALLNHLSKSKTIFEDGLLKKLVIPASNEIKKILELLGLPHEFVQNEFIIIYKESAKALLYSLGIKNFEDLTIDSQLEKISSLEKNTQKNTLDLINEISLIKLRDKSGLFIGARMGRPEKAKMRQLTGSPHVLFPVGEAGGRLRSFQSALEKGKIRSDFPIRVCPKCTKETIYNLCEVCNKKTKQKYYCKICGTIDSPKCQHTENAPAFRLKDIDINHFFNNSLNTLKIANYPDLVKGVRGTSNKDHIPENLLKGILRAKHEITVNKDGTTRYDMTQLPITHFKPKEINVSIEKLISLGYIKDIKGKEIISANQVLELKPQDVILPSPQESNNKGADIILFRTAQFIDELLEKFYGLPAFYSLKTSQDLIGQLIIALAPHTSAGILCRIIGFSKTQGFFAHPLLHAATRRDCDGDEASVTLLLDTLINFSRRYLPAHRGSTQDACLVITSKLNPSEVDDMIFDVDIDWQYPLEFYEACLSYKQPWEIKLKTMSSVLGTEAQYQGLGFTHPNDDLNSGVRCSAYKTLPSMQEKLLGQMDLAKKIVAVDEKDVAQMVIEKHFLKDTKGNLRKFSMQEFRCVKCNEKYRRPPLIGKCTKCSGRIIFTIAEGSVIKYLEPSLSIAEKYGVTPYLKQSLELLKRRVESIFGKEKDKQSGLGKWF